jgi:hypothetical protein
MWLLAGGIGLGVLIAILIVAALSSRSHDALPDQLGRLQRLHTAQAGALEDQMGSLKIGDLKIEVASYGSADEVELVLFRYSNLPTTPRVDAMLRGAAAGIIGVGGAADFDAETVHTVDGIDYRCIPFTGRLFPDDPAATSGEVCAWEEGSDVAVLIDARTAVADEAASDAQTAHAALA